MKHFFAWILTAVWCVSLGAASAQTLPAAPPTALQGQNLKDWLRQNWYDGKRVELTYSDARGKMYNYVDNQDGKLVCVYSGYTENVKLDSTNTSTTVVQQINCEHTVPQSWFDEQVRMRSDIHHLFPTFITWNSNRGSDPFAEIPDSQTQLWMRGTMSQTTIPTTNINEYSEDTNSLFEPREDHKGNLARAIFYFYTMHQGQKLDPGKDVITAAADLNTLYQWHMADPVDARERERNRRVAKSQGNFNPYIAYPDLVARAWGFQVLPTFAFATATGSIAEGNTGTSTYTTSVTISPAPTAPLTVRLSLATATSTATSGTDFTFTSPQTLTFAAGQTTLPVTVTINGDLTPEADETVVLALSNPSEGGAVGGPAQHELTILNDDGPAPTIQFATAKASLNEGNSGSSTYTVNVTLTGAAPTAAVTVPVTVQAAGTTATTPADYTLTTTSLSFVAGQVNQTQTVTLTVVGDMVPEPNETLLLALGTPTTGGAVLGPIRTHELTILNDDVAPPIGPCTALFFSEYIEGQASNSKAIEIYNPSKAPIDLEGITVSLFANGATKATSTVELAGTIAPGDVYVIANTSVASPIVKAQTDLESNVGFFNGDDALLLMDGTDTLDIIGVIGQQPTGGWQVTSGSTTNATLVRKASVNRGQQRWTNAIAEWTFTGTDVYDNIGRHTSECVTVTATTGAARLGEGLEVYPNPATGRVQVRLPQLQGRQSARISLYNMLGQLVLSRTQPLSAAEAATLDVQPLAEGLYLLRVTADGVTYNGRVQVQK